MQHRIVKILMNGVTGRMGRTQHLAHSILAIRNQGGIRLRNGEPCGQSRSSLAEMNSTCVPWPKRTAFKELGSAATSIGLTVPTDLSEDQKAEYAKLSKLTGKNFDKEYIDLMVTDHTDDLAAFQKAESTTQDPELKKAISGAIPVIQEHLNMAKSDAAKVGT